MLNQLNQISLFQDLDFRTLERIGAFCTKMQLRDGEVLMVENETENRSPDLFALCAGCVEIISNGSAVTSDEIVISNQDKDVLGEISWLCNTRRTATVRARGTVEAIRIDGDRLRDFLDHNRETGYSVMQRMAVMLSQRLGETDTLLKQILWNTRL